MWSDVLGQPEVQVWTTFQTRVLDEVKSKGHIFLPHHRETLKADSYDNFILRDYPGIITVDIEAVADVLKTQLSGNEGLLSTDGSLNVFYVGRDRVEFSIQINRFLDEYSKQKRWKVLGWRQPLPDEYMGWGSYRPAGTHIHW